MTTMNANYTKEFEAILAAIVSLDSRIQRLEISSNTKIMKTGIELIAAERKRHTENLPWDEFHDDEHKLGEIASAAVCYAAFVVGQLENIHEFADIKEAIPENMGWPFEEESWKPSEDPIRNLVKAGAFIAAEIDRLQRATTHCSVCGKGYLNGCGSTECCGGMHVVNRPVTEHEEALKMAAADPAFAAAAKGISDGIADRVVEHLTQQLVDARHGLEQIRDFAQNEHEMRGIAAAALSQNVRPLAPADTQTPTQNGTL